MLSTQIPTQVAANETYIVNVTSAFIAAQPAFDCGSIQTDVSHGSRVLILSTNTTLASSVSSCNISAANGEILWSADVDTGAYFNGEGLWLFANATVSAVQGVAIASLSSLPDLSSLMQPGFPQYLTTSYRAATAMPAGLYISAETGAISGIPTEPFEGQVLFYVQNTISNMRSAFIGCIDFRITAPPPSSTLNTLFYIVPAAIGALVLFLVPVMLFIRERRKNRLRPYNFEEMLEALQEIESGGPKRVPREVKRKHVKLIDIIGEGNFGEVHKGVLDEIPGVPGYTVAVKALKHGFNSERANMLREAALMVQFDHPFVVRLIGVVTTEEPLLVLMEYCEHGSLKTYLQSVLINDMMRYRLAGDCAEGMAYLASHRFVHRDLAARNVLLSSERRAKISDFGLTRETTAVADYYRSHGGHIPLRWTAPEAIEHRKFSQQSDAWSFGVLMHEIWTRGETPYVGMNNQQVWVEVLSGYLLPCPARCCEVAYSLMQMCWLPCGERPLFDELCARLRQAECRLAAEPDSASQHGEDAGLNGSPLPAPIGNEDTGSIQTGVMTALRAIIDVSAPMQQADAMSHYEEVIKAPAHAWQTHASGSTSAYDSARSQEAKRTSFSTAMVGLLSTKGGDDELVMYGGNVGDEKMLLLPK